MTIKKIVVAVLLCICALTSRRATAQFILIDNFSNAVVGNLAGQTSDGPSNTVWHALTSPSVVTVTNSSTPGVGQPGSGTPLTTNAACTSDENDGAADISLPVSIPSSSTVSTIFMQFDMGPEQGSNNVNWAVVNTPGSDAGGGNDKIELNANVSGPGSGRFGLTIRDGGYFGWLSADGVNAFVPQNSTAYNIWFVINNSAQNFLVYMQDANTNGTDLPNLTKMWVSTTGAAGTLTSQTYTTNAIGFRNTTAGPLQYFVFGTGGGSGYTAQQFVYSVYEDPNLMDLTNPVTGAAPVTLAPPVITSEPQSEELFSGATAVFTIAAFGGGLHYQWQSNGVSLADGGNISGSATSVLTITNVSAANAASYSCIISNANTGAYKSTNSTTAALTLVNPDGTFESATATAGPLHFYAFDDTGSPSSGTEVAYDYEGGDDGIYGVNVENGSTPIAGPRPIEDGLPGFSENNYAAQFTYFDEPSHITITSPWNLNTNTVTITAWIYPNGGQLASAAMVFNRGNGNDVEGLNMTTDGSSLGYTWNNDPGTTGFDSGLQPPLNQWSFVALVVTSTNAMIHLMNTNGILTAENVFNHVVTPFDGTTMIGDDSGTISGARTFNGAIDEVTVYNQALSRNQMEGLFTNASGVAVYPPTNSVFLETGGVIYPGMAAQFGSIIGGSDPLSYTWQLNGANLTDGPNGVGTIYGSSTPSLTISNLAPGDAGQSYNLTLVSSNTLGFYTSSPPAVLTVSTPSGPATITTLGMEASGTDWNTGTNWSDGNPASVSVFTEPGSTYEVVPGTLERSPVSSNAVFPGVLLVVEGNGALVDGGGSTFATNTTTGELRLKQSGNLSVTNFGTAYTDGGSVSFPDLQLNGGQIDNGTSSKVSLDGQLDVLANSSIYVDSAADGSMRPIQINSFLTGSGTITYGYLSSSNFTNNDLIVSGTTNIFTGQWNVLQGTLLGSAPNSLGTNTITVSTNGALETTYNINDPKGSLVLYGKCFLYTSNTFYTVSINGATLAAGTYSFAQLNSTYPANFPATWPVQIGSTTGTNTGFGYLTVITNLPPDVIQQPTPASLSLYPGQSAQFSTVVSGALSYQWWFTNLSNVGMMLSDGSGILGSQSNVLTLSDVNNGSAGAYTLVVTNTAGPVTSSSATLTILTPGPATTITMSVVEISGQDWDTGINWSDGNPASLSAYSEPGSTYIVLPGALLRTPAAATNTAFPGVELVVTNSGTLLLEHVGARSMAFPDMRSNGGSIDNGADGLATVTGELDISNNVTIYTDTNSPAGLVVNFDVPGGVGGTNYAGSGAYPDLASHTNWNPIVQVNGTGTTTPPATNSDGVTTSPITLTVNNGAYGEGSEYGAYGSFNNHTNTTPPNTPVTLEDNYLYIDNTFTPGFAQNFITNTLNNVPAGTYNLYLYGNNGGHAPGGFNDLGMQNDWGTIFTVSSDVASPTTLSTSNQAASYTLNTFIQGADYVVFSNVVVGAGGTITFTYTANTNVFSADYAGPDAYAAFNGLQLAAVVPSAPGPRPTEIRSLLTGNGTISYSAGDTNFESDLDIDGAGNTFSGQWNIVQGALLGGATGSLGTNTIAIGPGGALETSYNINNPTAGLVLNGKMFLHTSDTFQTLTVDGSVVNAGTYTFGELNGSFPANFPASWRMQTNSSVNSASGQIVVLAPVVSGGSSTNILTLQRSGSNVTLTWTNGNLQSATNLLGTWTNVAGATSPFSITPTNPPVKFYRIHP